MRNSQLRWFYLKETTRSSITLSRHSAPIRSQRRHSRDLLLSTNRLFSITGGVHRHVPFHLLDAGFRFLILELTASKLFVEKGILLFLLLGTLSISSFCINRTTYILSNILQKREVRRIANCSRGRIIRRRRTKSGKGVQSGSFGVSHSPSNTVLCKFFLRFVIELVNCCCIRL